MKKIVAHIQRTVTITTIHTAMDVSVSEDDPSALAIARHDPSISITIPEGEKSEKIRDDSINDHSAGGKPAGGVRATRYARSARYTRKRESNRAGG
jgi:hypothetical protein